MRAKPTQKRYKSDSTADIEEFGILKMGAGSSVGAPYGMKADLSPAKVGDEARNFDITIMLDSRKIYSTQIPHCSSSP